jgi:hypothetical protein
VEVREANERELHMVRAAVAEAGDNPDFVVLHDGAIWNENCRVTDKVFWKACLLAGRHNMCFDCWNRGLRSDDRECEHHA